jgi:hypothetical protein
VRRGVAAAGGAESADAAVRSAARLDDALRQYRAETGSQRAGVDALATLVAGATRVRLIAFSLSTLAPARNDAPLGRCGQALIVEADWARRWYEAFERALVDRKAVVAPRLEDEGGGSVIRCVSESLLPGRNGADSALSLVWAAGHLESLRRLGAELAGPAGTL